MIEISSRIQSGFQCPYRGDALCITKCENHKYVFSTWTTAAVVSAEGKKTGIEFSRKQLRELIGNLIQQRTMDGSIKEIDCFPTFPELQ